jgi:predicted DNA-binding protein (MmcQ/YjbR family)
MAQFDHACYNGTIDDAALRLYIETAWELVAPKLLRASRRSTERSEVPDET